MIFSDLKLAQRLERTEARSNASFVEARARLYSGSGATWTEIAGAYALFDGPASELTQSFGLGIFGPVSEAELTQIEQFFTTRGASVQHEVSPLADTELLALLPARGYRPVEYTNVLYRRLDPNLVLSASPNPQLHTRRIAADEVPLWAETSAAGWHTEHPSLGEFMLEFGRISASSNGAVPFLAELNGEAIGTGGLFINKDVALLAGASTVPAGRRQGAQLALLEARLRYAFEQGCTLAMMGALPGSQSQRNAEKQGFRIAYTRIKWALAGG
ncbi:GNAT family N-acetyltransferase [Hymenobacter koreensis]|uniref:N-acetyltransferase domain-containing protein n=1 Tax=Hymenobacter koreensis TaxID=1084523 RepID=A0ABP8J1U7_9BACT